MRSPLTWTAVAMAIVFGVPVVGPAALTSPLQDWDGNTTEPDGDRVLIVCFSLMTSIGLSTLASVLLWLKRGRNGPVPAILAIPLLLLVTALLLGVKWFRWYQG